MKDTPVLVCDFDCPVDWVEDLKRELHAVSNLPISIHHERFVITNPPELTKQLSAVMAKVAPDLVIVMLSERTEGATPGIFQALLARKFCPPILAVPESSEPSTINGLYELGASDYLIPPFRSVDVRPRVQRLLTFGSQRKAPAAVLCEELGLKRFVCQSPAMLRQIEKLPRIARCDATVLITGETGTGKEVCARAIHYLSPRAERPFVPLNCGAIPGELLENELFGHGAGAFTSANAPQSGLVQEANEGTLFLDEVDCLPLSAQVKLLRFLQDKEFRPLGARKTLKADVRIIAASNADLEEAVKAGKLRRDLLYRLNVLPLHLPPLRERREDIPPLARHFLVKYTDKFGAKVRDLAPAALRKLMLYQWPGNVRELENLIERAVVLSTSQTIQSDEIDLPADVGLETNPESFGQLKAQLVADFERNYLQNSLQQYKGNIAQAARAAQKNRRVFFQLMRKHHLRVEHVTVAEGDRQVVNVVIAVDKIDRPPLLI